MTGSEQARLCGQLSIWILPPGLWIDSMVAVQVLARGYFHMLKHHHLLLAPNDYDAFSSGL